MEQLLITTLAGLFIGLLGYLIKYRDKPELIAGFDREKFADVEGLKDFIGSYIFVVGGLAVVTGVLDFFSVIESEILWMAFSGLMAVIVLRLLVGVRKFR